MTEKERLQKASEYHAAGYNCCQSVLLALEDLTGLPESAAGVGYCFGGGMQRGLVCGALSGGLMALGACLKGSTPNDNRPLARSTAIALEQAFEHEFGTVMCSEILAANGKRICGECIDFCVKTTAELIKKINKGEP